MSFLTCGERFRIPTYDNDEYATTGRVTIDRDRCNGCGLCASICPGKAIYLSGEGKEPKAYLEEEFPQCMSCNDCAAICEKDAITASVTYDFGYFYKTLHRGDLAPPRDFEV